MSRSLTLVILCSTEVRAVVVAKLAILGISFLTAFILALRVVLVPKLVISGILSSIFLILVLCTSFLTTLLFTTLLSLLKSTGTVLIYQPLVYLLYFSNYLNYLVHF